MSTKRSYNKMATGGQYAANAPFKAPRKLAMTRSIGFTRPSLAELKFKDTTAATAIAFGSSAWTTPGAAFLLNGLVPDSTGTGRIGRRVVMKSIYIRASWALGGASTGGAPLRMLVVLDKQANGAAPAVVDVVATDSFYGFNNISNSNRFLTLFDQVLDPVAAGSSFTTQKVCYKKLNLPVQYNAGTAGTITDIATGSVYIMFSQSGGVGTANGVAAWNARVRYSDS